MSTSQCSADRSVADGASPRFSSFTIMAPSLSSFPSSTFDLRTAQAQAAHLNNCSKNPPNVPSMGSYPSCQVNGLNSGTPMLALPDSVRISQGSAQCSQPFFLPSSHGSGNSSHHPFFGNHPVSNVLMSGKLQQVLLSTVGYSSAITSMLPPSASKSTTGSPNTNSEFYGYNDTGCMKELKTGRFGSLLRLEEASSFRQSPVLSPNQHQTEGLSSFDTTQSVASGWRNSGMALEDPSKGALALHKVSQGHFCDTQQQLSSSSVFKESNSHTQPYCNAEISHLISEAFSRKENNQIIFNYEESLPETLSQPCITQLRFGLSYTTPENPERRTLDLGVTTPVRDQSDVTLRTRISETLELHVGETMTINASFTDRGFSAPVQVDNSGHGLDEKVPCPSLKDEEDLSTFEKDNGQNNSNCPAHKRSFLKTKLKDPSCVLSTDDKKATLTESSSKRHKYVEPVKEEDNKSFPERSASENSGNSTPRVVKEGNKPPPDPQKTDYIHVRARRGQATDSHSLAERVRREKISERMKFLQDLVPGCNKVTGKAVMLDEIINYVQSLQRQVEFLSMKLAAVNSRVKLNSDSLVSKEISKGPILQTLTSKPQPGSNCSQNQPQKKIHIHGILQGGTEYKPLTEILNVLSQDLPVLPACIEEYGDVPQKKSPWECELQSVVQMGFSHSRQCPLDLQELQG